MKKLIFIIIFMFSTNAFSASEINNYVCELLLNENSNKSPLMESAPKIIQISYDPDNNKLLDLLWDGETVTKNFVAVDFSSSSKILEFWRDGFTYSQEDNVLFELYSSDLVAHMYKLYVPGLDYQCSEY